MDYCAGVVNHAFITDKGVPCVKDCIGFGGDGWGAIHTMQQARLYEHLGSVITLKTHPSVYDYFIRVGGVIEAYGYKCSVVHLYQRGVRDEVWSLYKFLQNLCRDYKICLMSYDRVLIGNAGKANWLVVDFKHDRASDIYFTKMYMEAVCG